MLFEKILRLIYILQLIVYGTYYTILAHRKLSWVFACPQTAILRQSWLGSWLCDTQKSEGLPSWPPNRQGLKKTPKSRTKDPKGDSTDQCTCARTHVILCEINSTRPDSQSASEYLSVFVFVFVSVSVSRCLSKYLHWPSTKVERAIGRSGEWREQDKREREREEKRENWNLAIFFIIFARNANNTRCSLLILWCTVCHLPNWLDKRIKPLKDRLISWIAVFLEFRVKKAEKERKRNSELSKQKAESVGQRL